ncbi:MAG: iron ABC transporter permease [Zestosphaera sp.]
MAGLRALGFRSVVICLLIADSLLILTSILFIGRLQIPLQDLIRWDGLASVVIPLRASRVFFATVAGFSLGVAGAVMQAIFRNPLASPDILGVSQGAAFGAALGILLSQPILSVQMLSFTFATASLAFTLATSRLMRYGDEVLRLVLAGIAVSALFSAGVGYLKYMADPYNKLPQIVFWTMGSFASVTSHELTWTSPLILTSITVLLMLSWRINVLSLGDELSKSLGIDPLTVRTLSISLVVLSVSAVTSVSGIVSWVGLISPHIARGLVGADSRKAMPVSCLIGSILLLISDDMARTVSPSEIPLNIVTSLASVPILIVILSRGLRHG